MKGVTCEMQCSLNLQVKEALVFRCLNHKRTVSYGLRRDFFELRAIQEASGQKSHKNLRAHFAFYQNARPCCSIIGESGFSDVFVDIGRVGNDFIQCLTLVLQEEDLRNFEDPFEAVSPMFVSRIFVCKLTVRSVRDGDCFCRQIATRSFGD